MFPIIAPRVPGSTGWSPSQVRIGVEAAVGAVKVAHTRTGKRLEVPVKRLIQGHPLDQVASRDAVDDFDALAQFTAYAWRNRVPHPHDPAFWHPGVGVRATGELACW